MKSIKVISPGILLLAMLMGWVELAYSRPGVAVKPRGRQSSRMDRTNNTSVWAVPNQQEMELEHSLGMDRNQPDVMTHVKLRREKMKKDALEKIMTDINLVVKNKNKSMSRKEADVLTQFLVDKSSMRTGNKKELIHHLSVVARKHYHVGKSLQVLRTHVQNNRVKLSAGQYENLLNFFASLREINPLAQNSTKVTAATVLLNLGANAGDVVTWPDATRKNAMSLFKTYVRERADASGPEQALEATLKNRGYKSVAERFNRMKDIFENCKAA